MIVLSNFMLCWCAILLSFLNSHYILQYFILHLPSLWLRLLMISTVKFLVTVLLQLILNSMVLLVKMVMGNTYKKIRILCIVAQSLCLSLSVTSQQGLTLSPFLNFDPSYLPENQAEYIFPEGAVKQRGRFELAFSQIGTACIVGAGIGGTTGLYRGLKSTSLAGQTGKLRRTQLINHVMKNGSALANTLGVVSVMYSGFGVLLSWARGTDDSLNTLAAATATGMLYKSTNGLRKSAQGGLVGLGIASLYCLWNSREVLSQFRHHNINPA